MLKKINDPEYRLPYILGTGRRPYTRKYDRYRWIEENDKIVIPKDFKKQLFVNQRKFGTSLDEFNEEDYQKYL